MAQGAAGPGDPRAKAAAMLGRETPLVGAEARDGRVYAERAAGMRCAGCGERIETGFRFTHFEPVLARGQRTVNTKVVSACSREECDFADRVRQGASAAELLEFAWLDDDPGAAASDASPDAEKPDVATG